MEIPSIPREQEIVKLYVYHTPELVPSDAGCDCAIAIDVLRATTTMATALANGADSVQAFSDIDDLMRTSEAWSPKRRIRAGERGGSMVEGCDLGNSPLDYTRDRVKNCRVFMTTTNGTRALKRIQDAPVVLAAALVNRKTAADYLLRQRPETSWLVGSGWEGSFSLEDTVCAGAIVQTLLDANGTALSDLAGNDETIAAVALYRQWRDRLVDLMHCASHGQRLLRLDGYDDLKYCAQTDILDVLPMQTEPGVLAASQT